MNKDLSTKEEEVKWEICRAMGVLYSRGLISATEGNISARMPEAGEFWITPSGLFKGGLIVDKLIKVDFEGNILEGSEKPSIETPMHRAIYKTRPEVNAIVHAHNPVTVGLALAGIAIQPVTVGAAVTLGKVSVIPFILPGTEDLAKAVARHIAGAKVLILQNHGVVAVGSNIIEAEAIVETLEEVATAEWVAYHFGKPSLITEEDIKRMRKLYKA